MQLLRGHKSGTIMAFASEARWQKRLASTLSKYSPVSVPCADKPVLGFPKLKAQCLRVLTRSGETNPFVVRAVRRQIHSLILGADK